MSLVAFLGDSRGKRWDDGLKCYEQIIAEHELGPDTINLHAGGSSSGRERFYTVKPYGGQEFDLDTPGLLDQIDTLIAMDVTPDTVVINSTGNDQLIISQMYPVDSDAEQATIDAQQWVKDYRYNFFLVDNLLVDHVDFARDGWNSYSKHKLAEAIRTLKYNFNCEVIVIGPLGWHESPLANRTSQDYKLAKPTAELYASMMYRLAIDEGAKFLSVFDIQGPWKANEGDTAIHIGQEGHDEIARRLLNRDWV